MLRKDDHVRISAAGTLLLYAASNIKVVLLPGVHVGCGEGREHA